MLRSTPSSQLLQPLPQFRQKIVDRVCTDPRALAQPRAAANHRIGPDLGLPRTATRPPTASSSAISHRTRCAGRTPPRATAG